MRSGQLGLRYEQGITRLVIRLQRLRVPVVAVITGHCYGAGLLLAAASDIRIATPSSRFGVSVATGCDDIVETVYGSEDFSIGTAPFSAAPPPPGLVTDLRTRQ